MTMTLHHGLHPTEPLRLALDRRFDAADAAWRLLALNARSEAGGESVPMRCTAQRRAHPEQVPAGHGRIPQRSVAAWRAEFGPVADDQGWTALLGRQALDSLLATFRRQLKALGPVSRLSDTPTGPPSRLKLLTLVRPVSSLWVELVGVGPVLAPVFALPGPAGQAMDAWRRQFGGRLRDTREGLALRLLAGDALADREYLRHVAQYGDLDAQLAAPLARSGAGPAQLAFLEETELERCCPPGGLPGYRVHWAFRVRDVTPPRDPGLIACDPGIRTLYAWATRHGVGRLDSPLTVGWAAPPPAPHSGWIDRVLDLEFARLSRMELLHARQVRPVLDVATALFLDHRYLALELTDLAGMRRRRLDFPAFAETTGLDLHLQFLRGVAAQSGDDRQVLDIEPAGTTADCAACGAPRAMAYRGRWGRCAACGQERHRDENGALNVYARAARQLGWAT